MATDPGAVVRLRVERAKSDSPRLPLTMLGVALCGVLGYRGALSVRWPREMESGAGLVSVLEPVIDVATTDAVDAGRAVVLPVVAAGPRVPVRIPTGVLQGCGDGEETNLAPSECDAPAALEAALRTRLTEVLSQCPIALDGARDPSRTLSIGLRVDRPRHRMAVLLGRSSTVADRLSYVACVREQLGPMDNLWPLAAAHPRYLYYFVARFGPLVATPVVAAPVVVAPVVVAPVVAAPVVAAPVVAAPVVAAPVVAATPEPAGLPTVLELQRMRSIGAATVTWGVAIIRDAPRTGAIVGRLVQGTAVEMVDRRSGWYAIRWGHGGTSVGWTFRDAIGQ